MREQAVRPLVWMLLLLAAGWVQAHDVWLEADRYVLAEDEVLIVRQLLGSELDVETELALLRRMTPRFELITADGSVDLMGALPDERTRPNVKPVVERRPGADGLALVAMEHDFIYTEFTRRQFRKNLKHERFDVGQFREWMGRGPMERERYARALKCLVRVGESTRGALHGRATGQKLEILLRQNPYRLDPGDDLDVQVLFGGRPLPDREVTALNRGKAQPVRIATARTDAKGLARFNLSHPGLWLIRLVHLFPCDDPSNEDCLDVDWESHWAAYSFELD